MIKTLVIFIVALIAVIFGLSTYLGPNDMKNCGQTPGTNVPCTVVDAIVTVSGGDTNARTDQAIKLYQNGWSNILIFSGAAEDKSGPSNAEAMRVRAIAAGVPTSRILLDESGATTEQNAQNTQLIFKEQSIKSIILVTSGYHQRRAFLEFQKASPGVTIANSPVLVDKDWSAWWWLTPRGWWLAFGELFRIVAFYTAGA